MKFSSLLFLAPFILAAPSDLKARQMTVVDTLESAVDTLKTTVSSSVASIMTTVGTIGTVADTQIISELADDYDIIIAAIQAATSSITGVTTGAVGGIGAALTGLSQQKINQLVGVVAKAEDTFASLEPVLTFTATDLTPTIFAGIEDKVDAIGSAFSPFLMPLLTFAEAVQTIGPLLFMTVTGLIAATSSFATTIGDIFGSLNLPPLGIFGV